MSDETWNYKTKPLGYFEYCPCGCNTTQGELLRLGLDIIRINTIEKWDWRNTPEAQYRHANSTISEARARLIQKSTTAYGRSIF